MKVCLLQCDPRAGQANIPSLSQVIAGVEADLYVLPELFMVDFEALLKGVVTVRGEHVPEGATSSLLSRFMLRRVAAVMGGVLEWDGQYSYNTAVVIGDGWFDRYRQKHRARTSGGIRLNIREGDYHPIVLPSGWT